MANITRMNITTFPIVFDGEAMFPHGLLNADEKLTEGLNGGMIHLVPVCEDSNDGETAVCTYLMATPWPEIEFEPPTIQDALEFVMDQRGWTQTDLARELGTQKSHVSEILRGKRTVSLAVIKRAYALGIPARVLLGDVDFQATAVS